MNSKLQDTQPINIQNIVFNNLYFKYPKNWEEMTTCEKQAWSEKTPKN